MKAAYFIFAVITLYALAWIVYVALLAIVSSIILSIYKRLG